MRQGESMEIGEKEPEATPAQRQRKRIDGEAKATRAGLSAIERLMIARPGSKKARKEAMLTVLLGDAAVEMSGRLCGWFDDAVLPPPVMLQLRPLELHQPFRSTKASELPHAEAAQHGVFRFEVADRDNVGSITEVRVRNLTPSVLDWYWRKGTIDEQMRKAGHKFAQLHFEAGKVPRTNVMYRERIQSSMTSGDMDKSSAAFTQAQRGLEDALRVLSPSEIDVMRDVAGHDMRAGSPGRTRLLQLGLRALAVHFDIPFNATTGRRKPIKISKPENSA